MTKTLTQSVSTVFFTLARISINYIDCSCKSDASIAAVEIILTNSDVHCVYCCEPVNRVTGRVAGDLRVKDAPVRDRSWLASHYVRYQREWTHGEMATGVYGHHSSWLISHTGGVFYPRPGQCLPICYAMVFGRNKHRQLFGRNCHGNYTFCLPSISSKSVEWNLVHNYPSRGEYWNASNDPKLNQ